MLFPSFILKIIYKKILSFLCPFQVISGATGAKNTHLTCTEFSVFLRHKNFPVTQNALLFTTGTSHFV
jgi:hypothetical protein